ncbi:hypothetical protein [Parasedimentitalea maritima]|uniref:hypothetical protein n=1 Tax=Parasedimentitalea maritima TaxID=2578117 RepID=UPI00131DB1AC|nr:hypothetical protein [Zongyanglinia marina]
MRCNAVKAGQGRGWEVLGHNKTGVTGFLANPATEGQLTGRGVWFAPDTYFVVYPNIPIVYRGVERVMVMGDNGAFAAIALSALTCFPSGKVEREEEFVQGPRVLVGRHSRYGIAKKINCGTQITESYDRDINWSFKPVNVFSLGASYSYSHKAVYDGEYSKTIYAFYDELSKEQVIVREVQSCSGGAANNDPRWEIEVGNAGPFTFRRELLQQLGAIKFSIVTGKPIVSCGQQLDVIKTMLSHSPLPKVFYDQVASVIGEWDKFRDFKICHGTGRPFAPLG